VDDAVQFFQERHFDGVYPTFYKYQITQEDIDRGRARPETLELELATTISDIKYSRNCDYLQLLRK
jgi:hypothetical protein